MSATELSGTMEFDTGGEGHGILGNCNGVGTGGSGNTSTLHVESRVCTFYEVNKECLCDHFRLLKTCGMFPAIYYFK